MRANEKQREVIQVCIDTLKCLRDSNDITSPSHFTDAEMEVDKLDLPRLAEVNFQDRLTDLISAIRLAQW
jgi:hypothetical protein